MKPKRYDRIIIFCIFIGTYFHAGALQAQEVVLLFAGDAMQHQSQIDHAYRNGRYDYTSYFEHLAPEIAQADMAVVNLEVTLGGTPYRGYPMFSAPDEFAIALKDAGFDIFLTANNHILDRSSKGLLRTLDVLDSLEVEHTGVFRDLEERDRLYPLMVDKNGLRLAFLNYTYATNGIDPVPPIFVNYIDKEQMQKDIKQAQELNADIIIANMHWGDEYQLIQSRTQEQTAQFLIEEGVDIVMGSHPHVVQPSKAIRDSQGAISHLIVYSLGNFVSAMVAENTYGGQIIKVVLSKKADKTEISSCQYLLHYTEKKKNGNKTDFSIVPVSLAEPSEGPLSKTAAIRLDPTNAARMRQFARKARTLFNQYNEEVSEYKMDIQQEKEIFSPNFFPRLFAE